MTLLTPNGVQSPTSRAASLRSLPSVASLPCAGRYSNVVRPFGYFLG